MLRVVLLLSVMFLSQLASAQAPPATAVTEQVAQAQAAFDQAYASLPNFYKQIDAKWRESRTASGAQRAALLAEVDKLKKDIQVVNDQLISSGLVLYRNDPKNEQISTILRLMAEFYVVGDPNGDGGDQYEKALPLIQALIDAGAAEQTKELWIWGGAAAFCTNQFELAEQLLQKAQSLGLFQGLPPGLSKNPKVLVKQRAKGYLTELPELRAAWAIEQQIRVAEAQADNLPRVKFTTTQGDIVIELFENEAPQAVANIITLVKKGYYNGIVFHRVLPQFMAQGGDPTGSGGGGPGYNIRCECHGSNIRKHFRGSLSMAHAGRDTGGSQFFLTFIPTSYLDGRHTVFGRVVEGIDAASALKRRDPNAPNPPAPDKIIQAEVLRDRGHAYEFEKLPSRR